MYNTENGRQTTKAFFLGPSKTYKYTWSLSNDSDWTVFVEDNDSNRVSNIPSRR